MKAYYERRAMEYDDWYLGAGAYAGRARPGWQAELEALGAGLASLPPARTLDVGCGTGFLTRHLRGEVTCLDQSPSMLTIVARRLTLSDLSAELGGAETLFAGRWFVAVRTPG